MNRREFVGRSAQEAKRRALNFWYANRADLGLSLSQFFANCRATTHGTATCITFYPRGPQAARSAA